ncbi:MAG: hypothetical protein P8Y95_06655 [Gammaproteobacteria bacterium]
MRFAGQGSSRRSEKRSSRDPDDATTVMLQMTVTKENADAKEFVEAVKAWPVNGVAFTFYVPRKDERGGRFAWDDLRERDIAVRKIIELKKRYPIIKANVGALERMLSDVSLESTGEHGETCNMKHMLPLYVGDGGTFERTFCCYGNDVDCSRCGAYAVFNSAFHRGEMA